MTLIVLGFGGFCGARRVTTLVLEVFAVWWGRVSSLWEIRNPYRFLSFLLHTWQPRATPIVTRGEGCFSYHRVSTRGARHSPEETVASFASALPQKEYGKRGYQESDKASEETAFCCRPSLCLWHDMFKVARLQSEFGTKSLFGAANFLRNMLRNSPPPKLSLYLWVRKNRAKFPPDFLQNFPAKTFNKSLTN